MLIVVSWTPFWGHRVNGHPKTLKITWKTAPASANGNPPEPCKKTEKEKRNTHTQKKKEKKTNIYDTYKDEKCYKENN